MSDACRCKGQVRFNSYKLPPTKNTTHSVAATPTWSRKDCGRSCMAHCAVEGAECQDWYEVPHVVC